MNNVQNIKFDKATKIYYGKDNNCRCGCKGNYAEPGSRTFTRYANAIKKLGDYDFHQECSSWVNIPLPNNKAYTVYFD